MYTQGTWMHDRTRLTVRFSSHRESDRISITAPAPSRANADAITHGSALNNLETRRNQLAETLARLHSELVHINETIATLREAATHYEGALAAERKLADPAA
jgi:hypothetical protein